MGKSRLRVFTALLCAGLMSGCLNQAARTGQNSRSRQSAPEMLEKALPAVVTVAIYNTVKSGAVYGFSTQPSDVAYRKGPNLRGAFGAGSGFIIERSGRKFVITNAHVIEALGEETKAVAGFSIDGTKYPLTVVGADTFYDIAVLEFNGDSPGQETGTLEFADREPRIGETVFALGNPMGEFPYSVTTGIISGKNRKLRGQGGMMGKFGFLQSSATVTWGNSGGPLIDQNGRVVGINSQNYFASMPFGTFLQQQLNFALESGVAQKAVSDIIQYGRMKRAYLGVLFTQAWTTDPTVALDRTTQVDGLPRICRVIPDGPAGMALKGMENCVVNRINDVRVQNLEEVLGELENIGPGREIVLGLEKDQVIVNPRFVTGELTMSGQALLGSEFLAALLGMDSVAGEDSILLSPRKAARAPGYGFHIIKHSADLESYEAKLPEKQPFAVFTCGSVPMPSSDGPLLWRVKNMAQMGVAIRLAALTGRVTFSRQDFVESYLVYQGDGEEYVKVLLY
jgi:S1-C subfamily serine protease